LRASFAVSRSKVATISGYSYGTERGNTEAERRHRERAENRAGLKGPPLRRQLQPRARQIQES
jgi:hypothetical protein